MGQQTLERGTLKAKPWSAIIALLGVVGMSILGGAAPAMASNPTGATFTASSTELTINYNGSVDSVDVNITINGQTKNYHPNTGATGTLVLTYASLGLPNGIPSWVQVHPFDCHIGEPGSPGYGTVCYTIPDPPVDPPVDPPTEKVCTGSGSLTWTKNANLSEATVTLKEGFTSCDVSLNSYETEGPTWETSGTQQFVDHDTVHLTSANPTGTLNVEVRGCYQQQDLYIGTTLYDGVDGALPHYPDSWTPENNLDWWNGGKACPPPAHESVTPKADWSTPVCDTTDYTVKGENQIILTANAAVAWTINKGDQTKVLEVGEGFNGPPPFGFGAYTATGSDGSSSDLFDVVTTSTNMTFVDPSTIDCKPPVIPTKPVVAQDHTCLALGTITITEIDGVQHFVDRGEGKVAVDAGVQYATSDGTATGTPLFTTIKVYAEKSGEVELSGTTYWEFVFTNPACGLSVSFLSSFAVCTGPGINSENSADLSGSEGVTFTYTRNGVDGGALLAGHYGSEDIEPGAYVITAHAPTGVFYRFPNGEKDFTFVNVTFPNESDLDCMVIITKPPTASSSDVCGVSNDTFDRIAETDQYTVKLTDNRVNGVGTVVQQLIPVFGYAFEKDAQTLWTFTFTNEACPPTVPPKPPVQPEPPVQALASTGAESPVLPIAGGIGALALGGLLLGFGLVRRQRAGATQD